MYVGGRAGSLGWLPDRRPYSHTSVHFFVARAAQCESAALRPRPFPCLSPHFPPFLFWSRGDTSRPWGSVHASARRGGSIHAWRLLASKAVPSIKAALVLALPDYSPRARILGPRGIDPLVAFKRGGRCINSAETAVRGAFPLHAHRPHVESSPVMKNRDEFDFLGGGVAAPVRRGHRQAT